MPGTGIADLPYELLERVLDDALQGQSPIEARSTCCKLCTTAKCFVRVTQARLFRHVDLVFDASSPRSRDFQETIERNETLAGYVEAVGITVKAHAGSMWTSICKAIVGRCSRIHTIRYAPENAFLPEVQAIRAIWDGCRSLHTFTLVLYTFGQLVLLPTKDLETLALQFSYYDLPYTRSSLPSSPAKPLAIAALRIENLRPSSVSNCEGVVSNMLGKAFDTVIHPPRELELHRCMMSMRSWKMLMSKVEMEIKSLLLCASRPGTNALLLQSYSSTLETTPGHMVHIDQVPDLRSLREKGVKVKVTGTCDRGRSSSYNEQAY